MEVSLKHELSRMCSMRGMPKINILAMSIMDDRGEDKKC